MAQRRESSWQRRVAGSEPTGARTPKPVRDSETVTLASPPDAGENPGVLRRGACIGRYVILRSIGHGAMGDVYAAYDPELDRQVAIKLLRSDLEGSAAGREAQARLWQEARTIARLDDPNVVSVYDVGTFGQQVFVTMELVEGCTLADWLQARARPLVDILRVFAQAGSGLASAHRAGVVHRDFKPGNVMVGDDGRVRVLDFGIARRTTGTGSNHRRSVDTTPTPVPAEPFHTREGALLGTPAYMAPEQRIGETVGPRADQYAFCASLFEALYRARPQPGIAAGVMPGTPRVSPGLRRALARGLAADPDDRHPSMAPLLAALRPSRRHGRRWLQLAGVTLVLASTAFGYERWTARQALCTGGIRHLEGVWDTAVRGQLAATFSASGLPGADRMWFSSRATLDRFADAWVMTHRGVCEATHKRGEQSEAVLDRQMACLDGRLDELRVVVESLGRGEPALLRNAPAVVDRMSGLRACARRTSLSSIQAVPAGDGAAGQIRAVRRQLAQSKTLLAAGLYPRGRDLAERALVQARSIDFAPLVAEAYLQAAMGHGRSGDRRTLETYLGRALVEAQASGHDLVLASALAHRVLAAYMRADLDDGRFWSDLTEATLQRMGGVPEIDARRRFFLAMMLSKAGHFAEALHQYQQVLALRADAGPLERSALRNNIGIAQLRLGAPEAARASMVSSFALLEGAYGPDHPNLVRGRANFGNLLYESGQVDQALDEYRASIAHSDRVLGSDHPDVVALLHAAVEALVTLGRPQEARPFAERAVALEGGSLDAGERAKSRYLLAITLGDDPSSRVRACSLAASASGAMAKLGIAFVDDQAGVDAWRDARGCR